MGLSDEMESKRGAIRAIGFLNPPALSGTLPPLVGSGGESRKPGWAKEGWEWPSTIAGRCHAASFRDFLKSLSGGF